MEKFAERDIEVRRRSTVQQIEKGADSFLAHSSTDGQTRTAAADLVVHAAGRAPDHHSSCAPSYSEAAGECPRTLMTIGRSRLTVKVSSMIKGAVQDPNDGVFSAEGDAWRRQRRLAILALAQRHLRGLYPKLRTVTTRLKKRWERLADAGAPLDVVDELKRFTVDVTTLITFGHDVNTVEQGNDVIQRKLELVLPAANRQSRSSGGYSRGR
jgi:hypothetical protein